MTHGAGNNMRYWLVCFFSAVVFATPAYAGNSVRPDLRVLEREAEEGNANSQLSLGLYYLEGREVNQDYKSALKWIRKSAEEDNGQAEAELGFLYAEGHAVPQDYAQAYLWLVRADLSGSNVPKDFLADVASHLSQQQIVSIKSGVDAGEIAPAAGAKE